MMYLELTAGLIYLLVAGDLLVRGSVALARRSGIPPMIVGLTVVAFGTSAPELFICLGSAFKGHPDIATGNIVGSNIANVLLVLGLPALIRPTPCNQDSLGRDTAIMLAATLMFVALCFLGPLGRIQGALLFAMLVILSVRSAREARNGSGDDEAVDEELERLLGLPTGRRLILLFIGLGVVGLPVGAHLMVEGAVELAATMGLSQSVIALTVVALGTSLPELATTIVAALHRHSDIALGNVLGSNLFNILAIMGVTAMVAPTPIPVPEALLRFDLFVMLGAAGVLAFFAFTRLPIGRGSGFALLAGYVIYVAILFGLPGAPASTAVSAATGY